MRIFAPLAAFLIFGTAFFSCASNKRPKPKDDFFYEENISQFKESALSNGIPVAIKNIPFEKNIELRLVFSGGASACPKGKSGMELLVFDLLGESNPDIKERLARGQYFSISACQNDFSYYGFSAAASDFFKSLQFFKDSILSPKYSHDDYLKKEAAAASASLSRSENPRFEILDEIQKKVWSDSPYRDGIYYKPTSRVSEYDIEKHLSALLNASRISIVAAGNFSYKEKSDKKSKGKKKSDANLFEARSQKLLEELESAFGGISREPWTFPAIPSPAIKGESRQELRSEFAGGDYHWALCFACPSRGDEDYEAFALSTLALDSLLSRELVERQKAAFYCGTAVLNGKQSLALIVASGKKEGRDIEEMVKGALKSFPQESELQGLLDIYKNIYVSRVIGASQNAGASLEQMISSIYYQGDAKAFLNKPKKIRAVTAQDMRGAFEKYFLSENSLFVLLTN